MAIHDFTSERLYVERDLAAGVRIALSGDQCHYLVNVLRLKPSAEVLVFNGRDGEWRARITDVRKRDANLEIVAQSRPQTSGPDIQYLFAPLKHARLDYMVQKAVELGVSRLSPVFTRRTVPDRINLERMRSNAIEAAEQCGILRLPEIDAPVPLERILDKWDAARSLIFCDEEAPVRSPLAVLAGLKRGPVAVLIGPEGGFDEAERQRLLASGHVIAVSLGPRIVRADTAAIAALTLVNATLGDWTEPV